MPEKQYPIRSNKCNRALHLWFEMLADELNESGLYMAKVLEKKSVDVPWTKETVKEVIYRPILQAYSGKKSTTQMTTKDIDAMLDILTKHLGENFGINVAFPSITQILILEEDGTRHHNQG